MLQFVLSSESHSSFPLQFASRNAALFYLLSGYLHVYAKYDAHTSCEFLLKINLRAGDRVLLWHALHKTGCGGACLYLSIQEVEAEDQKFKVIFCYIGSLKSAWAT